MLELKGITKIYPAGGEDVEALRGIDLRFGKKGFVSILGPSGCGKTTLLNIVGGLDQYTSGDLIINGKSTRDFKDRDWDAYRNHSIGFVFQNYNLIPHQSVLQNVELALTLSGVSRRQRQARAKQALERVGLKDQMKKRPAQMSGGQMQRVAIARAIVNNPDIILADEPTGALDTETSVQVMEILKEISQDRLVIMVTHNPDLAERYSTRIINMLDGKITSDSLPVSEEEAAAELREYREDARPKKLPSMSMKTAFSLSLKNLFTKKGRTILTSFAGSIGIIGIALIYAVSNGMTAYINNVQEDTLSAYPLMLEAQHMDSGSLLTAFMGRAKSSSEHPDDGVYQKGLIYEMMNALNANQAQENDLRSFKAYLESVKADPDSKDPIKTAVSAIQYTYDMQLQIYTRGADGKIMASNMQTLLQDLMGDFMQTDFSGIMALADSTMNTTQSAMMNSMSLWREMLPGENGDLISPLYKKQFDIVYGKWPSAYDEVILVTDDDGELTDMSLYALGLIPRENIEKVMQSVITHETLDFQKKGWSYEEICAQDYRVILDSDRYVKGEKTGLYSELSKTDTGLQYLYDNGLRLKVVGVARPSRDAVATTMTNGGIAYTKLLTEYAVEKCNQSAAVLDQMASPDMDILTGLPFRESNIASVEEKARVFRSYYSALNDEHKAELYASLMSDPTEDDITAAINEYVGDSSREELEEKLIKDAAAMMGVSETLIRGYLSSMTDEQLFSMLNQSMGPQIKAQFAETMKTKLDSMTTEEKAAAMNEKAEKADDAQCAAWYDQTMSFSSSTYEKNLKQMGYVDLDSPATINLYAATFADKDAIEKAIADYNETVDDLAEIKYTDYMGLIMSSVTTIIDAITYVLIAFVAISLIVSSIMIGVITLISVQERTKEIGILRAMGASKRNVSGMFIAETSLIGFASGALGVIITWLLCIPINAVLHKLTGISNLSACLDIPMALILVGISVILTLIAGVIPSASAAKKDPVVALRTE